MRPIENKNTVFFFKKKNYLAYQCSKSETMEYLKYFRFENN